MEYFVRIDDRTFRVELGEDGLRVDGELLDVELVPRDGTPIRRVRNGARSVRCMPRRNGRGDWTLELAGTRYRAEVLDAREEAVRRFRKAAGALAGPTPLKAPMPGLVVRVEVGEGDRVEASQALVIVEAMKMENELRAPAPARVKAVRVQEGDPVEKDQVLVEFESPEEEE